MDDIILLAHGSGGKLSHQLIKEVFLPYFDNPWLRELTDAAVFKMPKKKLAFTTDSYVVNPIFFPGGDIGKLAVCGTINDLAVMGAKPVFISCAFIIEEGFKISCLKRIVNSMAKEASEANVKIVTGDTKVVEKGSADKIFINTSGIGIVNPYSDLSVKRIKPGDEIIISGTIGDHGITVLSQREKLEIKGNIKSDCCSLYNLVESISKFGKVVKFMRDPTRGGLATTLNEIAQQNNLGIEIFEDKIPVKDEIRALCEMLGFDPLYLANEGKLLAVVDKKYSRKILTIMRQHKYGRRAQIIGRVRAGPGGKVYLSTLIGAERILDMPAKEPLPRIC